MYAITIDASAEAIQTMIPDMSYSEIISEINKFLRGEGFVRHQGGVYFGGDDICAVKAVMAVNRMGDKFEWLKRSSLCFKIRLLRVEDICDLSPALE